MVRLLGGLLIAVLAALTVPIGLGAAPATACSCATGSVADQAGSADDVFVGSVVPGSIDQGGRGLEPIDFDVAVTAVYAGDVPRVARLQTAASSASCGLGHVPEGRMIWFVYRADGAPADARLNVTLCTPPATADDAALAEVEGVLGASRPGGDAAPGDTASSDAKDEAGAPNPEASHESDADHAAWWAIGVGTVVLLGAAVGLIWSRSPRRRR